MFYSHLNKPRAGASMLNELTEMCFKINFVLATTTTTSLPPPVRPWRWQLLLSELDMLIIAQIIWQAA